MWAAQATESAKLDQKNWGQEWRHSYLHGQLQCCQIRSVQHMVAHHGTLAAHHLSRQLRHHTADRHILEETTQTNGLARKEVVMVSEAENQLKMDMGMHPATDMGTHPAMAQQSPHLKHLHPLFGMQLVFATCFCQNVALQNAI